MKVEDDQVGGRDCGLNLARETKRGATVCHSQQVPSFPSCYRQCTFFLSLPSPVAGGSSGLLARCRRAARLWGAERRWRSGSAQQTITRVEAQDRWLAGFVDGGRVGPFGG